MQNYIAAGFDPARFWDLTPRLYDIEMQGAARRLENRRAEIWMTAMLPRMEKPPTFEKFVGRSKPSGTDVAACLSAWDKIDAALARNKT